MLDVAAATEELPYKELPPSQEQPAAAAGAVLVAVTVVDAQGMPAAAAAAVPPLLAAYAAEVAEVAESAEAAEAAEAVQAAEAVETAEAAEAAGGQLPPALFTTCTTPRWTRDERLRVACRHTPKFARLTWYGMGRGKCGCVAWYQNGDTCHVKEASISGRRHDRASPAIVGKHPSGAHHFFGSMHASFR